tara:strand:- start:270 stop:758 length:489 start_codon:yes stop_codon:yes gene_type:complete
MSDAFGNQDNWDKTKTGGGGGGLFVKLGSGESSVGVMLGDPYGYNKDWGDRRQDRIKVNWFVTRTRELKILDVSAATFSDFKKARCKYGAQCALEFGRQGTGMQTKYQVMFDHNLTSDEVEAIKREWSAGGHDLTEPGAAPQGQSTGAYNGQPVNPDQDLPF